MTHLTLGMEDGVDDTRIRAEWYKLLESGRWTQPDKISDYASGLTDATLKRDSEVHYRKGLKSAGVDEAQIHRIISSVFRTA